ncbi:hypothetical protein I7I48_09628 [Histoplasma ohiense]|nr:hypothetical protein I7I48_09628 [Histoplasma ohiense (nom. inval.)]
MGSTIRQPLIGQPETRGSMRGDRREIDQKFGGGCLICAVMFGGAKENANCRFGTRRRQARIYAADAAVLHSIFSPRKNIVVL